jgi:hypothetical protein
MNSSQIQTPGDVIDRLGGTVAVAKLMGTDPRAVSNWRVRGLPPETFHAMDGLLRAKGLHAPPSLWRQREATSR